MLGTSKFLMIGLHIKINYIEEVLSKEGGVNGSNG